MEEQWLTMDAPAQGLTFWLLCSYIFIIGLLLSSISCAKMLCLTKFGCRCRCRKSQIFGGGEETDSTDHTITDVKVEPKSPGMPGSTKCLTPPDTAEVSGKLHKITKKAVPMKEVPIQSSAKFGANSRFFKDRLRDLAAAQYAESVGRRRQKDGTMDPDYKATAYIKGPYSDYQWYTPKTRVSPRKRKWLSRRQQEEVVGLYPDVKKEDARVSFAKRAATITIPRDQQLPHKLRKDRQIVNPFRRIYIHDKLKQVGGKLRNRKDRKVTPA